jgi:hypothetical protein
MNSRIMVKMFLVLSALFGGATIVFVARDIIIWSDIDIATWVLMGYCILFSVLSIMGLGLHRRSKP